MAMDKPCYRLNGVFRDFSRDSLSFRPLVKFLGSPSLPLLVGVGGVVVWSCECSLMLVVLSHGSWLLSCVGMKAISKSYHAPLYVVIGMWASVRMAFSWLLGIIGIMYTNH